MRRARVEREHLTGFGLVREPSDTSAAVEAVNENEERERDREKRECELVGGGVLDGLDVVVDRDGDGARGSGKIAADHEDDAKFAEGVSEGQNNSGYYARQRKRKNDASKRAPGIGAEDAGGGEKFWIEAFERSDERLNAKRKTIENAGDDKAGERESERVAEECEPKFAERAAWAHGDEEIKAKNRWRKNEGKRDDGFDKKFGPEFGEGEPVSERRCADEKNRGDEKGEAEREKEFGHGGQELALEMRVQFCDGLRKAILFENGLSRGCFQIGE